MPTDLLSLPSGPAQFPKGTQVPRTCKHMLNAVKAYGANYVNKQLNPRRF